MQILRDPKAAVSKRMAAADLAGELCVMNDSMAALLLGILGRAGESGELRARAAISLGPVLEETDIEGFDDDLGEPPISPKIFHQIQETLHRIYSDPREPKEVRRRALEASVRAPQGWHQDAIRIASTSDDEDWRLTAVFGMRWISGFDEEILEMLESSNAEIRYEAICAAGEQALEAAWPHVGALLDPATERRLLLAAMEAAASIRPAEAMEVLAELADSEDEEIAEAASEALMLAEASGGDDDDED